MADLGMLLADKGDGSFEYRRLSLQITFGPSHSRRQISSWDVQKAVLSWSNTLFSFGPRKMERELRQWTLGSPTQVTTLLYKLTSRQPVLFQGVGGRGGHSGR